MHCCGSTFFMNRRMNPNQENPIAYSDRMCYDNGIIMTMKGTAIQDRYSGDIGDYGKLGLLRSLSRTGLRIGVNWYLTPDEDHNGDGRHTDYLRDDLSLYENNTQSIPLYATFCIADK